MITWGQRSRIVLSGMVACGLVAMFGGLVRGQEADEKKPAVKPDAEKPAAKPEADKPSSVVPLTPEKQAELLAMRTDGRMGGKFGQFGNMYFVMSRLRLPYGVALTPTAREIAETDLMPVFPESYSPTVREFLDVLALQTFSQWKYDPTDKRVKRDAKLGPATDLAIYEFTKVEREKPYEVKIAKGWKAVDKGHWTMYVPPVFPVGMDIYEMGTYSSDDKSKEKELFTKVVKDVSQAWPQRFGKEVAEGDLKPVKVGQYDAMHYDVEMTGRNDTKLRWRQWTFMVDNKCYQIVSTILPPFEEQIYPDVQAMVDSFVVKPVPSAAGR